MTTTPLTELDHAIAHAYEKAGDAERANKVYQVLLRTLLYIPVEKPEHQINPEEPFEPLISKHDERYFLVAFDSFDRLKAWAGDHFKDIASVEISGRDVIRNIGLEVFLVLNLGLPYAKEFNPQEIARLKKVVAKTARKGEIPAE